MGRAVVNLNILKPLHEQMISIDLEVYSLIMHAIDDAKDAIPQDHQWHQTYFPKKAE